jgi:hypothetical protein
MGEKRHILATLLFLALIFFILVASSSGQEQGQKQEFVSLLELKNDTVLLERNNTELLWQIYTFTNVSESVYSQIVALDVNNTKDIGKINTDLLVEEFSKLLVKLSESPGVNEEKIRRDADNVLDEINTTLYGKIEELYDETEKLDAEHLEIKSEYANLSIELAVLENYTRVLEEKRELKEKLNTSKVALKENASIYFAFSLVVGIVLGSLFCFKLRKKQEFLKLFTREKERRPVFFALILSVIVVALAFYIGVKYGVFCFL